MSQMSNEYKRRWAKEHRESIEASRRKYLKNNPEARAKSLHNYYLRIKKRDAEKLAARVAVREGVRKGLIVRPKACSRCNKKCVPHGHHHEGYDRENWLNVIWLCLACHVKEHECQ